MILVVVDSPVHCRMFSSNPGLNPLDDSSIPSVIRTKNVSRHCQMSPEQMDGLGGAKREGWKERGEGWGGRTGGWMKLSPCPVRNHCFR